MDTLRRDLALAWRTLAQARTYTIAVIALLALAVGATTAVWSVVDGALRRPLPHVDVDRWADLYERPVNEGLGGTLSVSIPNYRDWRDGSRSFAEMVLWMPWSFNLAGDGQAPERVRATVVTPNLFRAIAVTPAAGRLLQPSDDPVNGRIAVISEALWERRFNRDPALVGRPVRFNHVPFTVVGVAPRDFTFPVDGPVDVWIPDSAKTIEGDQHRDARGMQVAALLRPGVTWERARAEMDVIAARLAARHPENRGFGVSVVPMRESLTGDIRRPLLTLLTALGLIVLLVSANVAHLTLVRIDAARQQLALRAALGASRARLIRQVATESTLLAAAAGVLGLLLAPLFVRGLLAFVPPGELPWLRVTTDRTMLVAAVAVAATIALLAGLLPALRAMPADVASALARGGRGTDAAPIGRRLRRASVVVQLALSLVLLVSAALVLQTFVRLSAVDPGFTTRGRMTLAFFSPRARYPDAARLMALADGVRAAVGGTPGVRVAGLAQALPFAPGVVWRQAVTRDDPRAAANLAGLPHVHYNVVTTGYAEALGLPVKAGRSFDATDTARSPPVVVVNEAFARRFFPGGNAVGQTLWVGHAQALPTLPRRTIVGIVGDARWSGLGDPPEPEAWVPYAQQDGGEDVLRQMFVVFDGGDDPERLMPAVRAAIAGVDGDLPLTSVRTLASRLGESVWRQRLAAAALSALGLAALAVALVGVLAVTAYVVGRRTHEMGVRLALGARPSAIVRLVLAESAWLVAAGAALGLGGALLMARLLASILFGVSATDATTLVAAATGLSAAAMGAAWLPARLAARVDPLAALRTEPR